MNIHVAVNNELGLEAVVRRAFVSNSKYYVSFTDTDNLYTLPCEAIFLDEVAACNYADLIVRNFGRVAQ